MSTSYTISSMETLMPQATAPFQPSDSTKASTYLQLNPSASQSKINQSTSNMLLDQGYSSSLVSALMTNKKAFPLRIWVIDNSGSMSTCDGNRVVMDRKTREIKLVSGCSRWSEMRQTVEYHAQMAAEIEAPTIFRLLNDPGIVVGPQQFSIAEKGPEYIDQELATAIQTMSNASPGGVTPLVQHMMEIKKNIIDLEPALRQNGTKVAVIIATDGQPTDNQGETSDVVKYQFEQILRSMEGLPMWLVVRLFTDEEDVVEYWNEIDSKLELSIEVLDDFAAEAKEIYSLNKWLNYGLPLHRIREMGFHSKLLDLLDEKKLSKEEIKQFCKLLFGHGVFDEAPDPELDWSGFCNALEIAMRQEKKQWNPITRRMEPWINVKMLKKEFSYGSSSCVIL